VKARLQIYHVQEEKSMSSLTINTWVNLENGSFHNFFPEVAELLESGWCRALTETLRLGLKDSNKVSVELPWGTYTAELIQKGEAGNITPSWEPSKRFMTLLNGDLSKSDKDTVNQETFDPTFVRLFTDWITHGRFYPEGAKNKEKTEKHKGIKLSDDEVNYVLNSYGMMLASIAKDKQRDGKIFPLEINGTFPHGRFDFEYDDDKITPTFVADKVFKQLLKDDAAAASAAKFDFTPLREGEVRKDIIPTNLQDKEEKAG